MRDDVLINKAATIERCVARARQEFDHDPTTFETNFSRQDAAVMNIQRACEAALDMGPTSSSPVNGGGPGVEPGVEPAMDWRKR